MIDLYFDGACNDNGKETADVGLGFWACYSADGTEIFKCSMYAGKGTNNVAEYKALIEGLTKLIDMGLVNENVIVKGDSNLIINQVFGNWKCNQDHLIVLRDKAKELIGEFKSINGTWIPRNQNQVADELSKEGIYKRKEVLETNTLESNNISNVDFLVIDLGDSIYKVKSKDKVYAVDLVNKVCSCPDNQYRRHECKHIRYIKDTYVSLVPISKDRYFKTI